MSKNKNNIVEWPKKYLEWAGFRLNEKKARFLARNWFDVIAATTYSVVSIVLICIQQADLIVLGLNIICLFRAMINNTICASNVTRKSTNVDIEKKREKNSHYHMKAGLLIVFLVLAAITWAVLLYEGNDSTLLIKIFASLAIVAVLTNDCENIVVCAYNASIEPVEG